ECIRFGGFEIARSLLAAIGLDFVPDLLAFRLPTHEAAVPRHAAGTDLFVELVAAPVHKVFFFQAEHGIRGWSVTGVQTCALPISYTESVYGGRRCRRLHRLAARTRRTATTKPSV